jgi:hypothetical protein
MAATDITLQDLAREPGDVARGLVAWGRGEPEEAALQTLAASARELYARAYTLWAWAGRTAAGEPAWTLPISASSATAFAPRGPARALVRCLDAAVVLGAAPTAIRLEDWRGRTCLVAPGMDEELASEALAEAHPPPDRARLARLPRDVVIGGPRLSLDFDPRTRGDGLVGLARELAVHPVRVALTLLERNQPVDLRSYPPELARALREWGCVGEPPAAPVLAPSLAIADDPCPRRRHARKVLQRLLRMGKVGEGYHTEFDHLYRGAPANQRRQALEVGEALIRAGLLGQKPSVGQRHVYLNVKALSEIHALIERGETRDPALASLWTAPAPAEAASRARAPRAPSR